MTSQFFFFSILAFWMPCVAGAWRKTPTAQIWWEWVHGGPRYGHMNMYIGPTEISVNWPGSKQLWTRPIYEPGQFTLISMGPRYSYSCGHISGHHEPIHVKFGVWGFFIMLFWNMVMKMLKCKKENMMMSHFSTLWGCCIYLMAKMREWGFKNS